MNARELYYGDEELDCTQEQYDAYMELLGKAN
jgi:hypothetical protein